jgi:hypothetical protein
MPELKNKMQHTNPNAPRYVNGTDFETLREENLIDLATGGCCPFCIFRRA